MKKATVIVLSLSVLAMAGLVPLLLWGKLFPFSPVTPGFCRHELAHTVVYVQAGATCDEYAAIDACVPSVERFHELRFLHKPKLFVFRDRQSYLQRSPSKARFCAFENGSLVISPWALEEARRGQISLGIYLRHELSHVLIFQYAGLLNAFRYPRWLLEGMAVYGSGQMGTSFYPNRAETYAAIRRGSFMPPECFHTRREDQVPLHVPYRSPFMYSEFACLVDALVTQYGKERFTAFTQALLRDPDCATVFRRLYGMDFAAFVQAFQQMVRNSVPAGA